MLRLNRTYPYLYRLVDNKNSCMTILHEYGRYKAVIVNLEWWSRVYKLRPTPSYNIKIWISTTKVTITKISQGYHLTRRKPNHKTVFSPWPLVMSDGMWFNKRRRRKPTSDVDRVIKPFTYSNQHQVTILIFGFTTKVKCHKISQGYHMTRKRLRILLNRPGQSLGWGRQADCPVVLHCPAPPFEQCPPLEWPQAGSSLEATRPAGCCSPVPARPAGCYSPVPARLAGCSSAVLGRLVGHSFPVLARSSFGSWRAWRYQTWPGPARWRGTRRPPICSCCPRMGRCASGATNPWARLKIR